MKDLQELFETLGTEEMYKLADLMDKKSVNPKNVKKVLDYIAKVYCGEMGVQEAELNAEEMEKLINSFSMSVALYTNVIKGNMEIVEGRMMLTDGESCKFRLTSQGIQSVENLIAAVK